MEEMQKTDMSLTFTCPECKETFEFDTVEEYEFVPCPICKTNLMTIRKGPMLMLEAFRVSQTMTIQTPVPIIL